MDRNYRERRTRDEKRRNMFIDEARILRERNVEPKMSE